MFSPASRLREATATVRTRSPLGTPPLSASNDDSAAIRPAHSPIARSSSDQLEGIFNAVRQQISRWGENAKWKIDLVLLDNPPPGSSAVHGSSSPYVRNYQGAGNASPITHQNYTIPPPASHHYVEQHTLSPSLPASEPWQQTEDLRQQLHTALERQRYLEGVVRSQAIQLQQSQTHKPDASKAIETMRSVYMMLEHEQRLRYMADKNTLQRDIEALTRKLRRMSSTLQSIETMELPPEDANLDNETLLNEREILRRKLHLAELRLSARDAELSYLYETAKTNNSHPSYYSHHPASPSSSAQSPKLPSIGSSASSRRGPPYLFQQQYSPKMRHEIKPPVHPKHMSALESLGIVADRMLSDPGFNPEEKQEEQKPASYAEKSRIQEDEIASDTKRSKRSIDSANALLSMPNLMFPQLNENEDVTMEEASRKGEGEPALKRKRSDVSMKWTPTFDELLERAVSAYGKAWDRVAKEIPGSTSQQCEERWNQRHPQRKRQPVEPDARQSPSIAALLDTSEDAHTPPPIHHYSPHATPPLAPEIIAETEHPPPEAHLPPGYRPPSPASTPKGRRHSMKHIRLENDEAQPRDKPSH